MSIRRWRHWTHSSGDVKTIKIGWSWPACLFTVPWLIYKRMWQALIWLVPTGLLAAIAIATFETESLGLDSIDIVIYPVILVSIMFGLIGNKLCEDKLRKQFYHASKVYTSAKTKKHQDATNHLEAGASVNPLAGNAKGSESSADRKRPAPIIFSASSPSAGTEAGQQYQSAKRSTRIESVRKTPVKAYSASQLVNQEVVLLDRSEQPSSTNRRKPSFSTRSSRRLRRIARPVTRIAHSIAPQRKKKSPPQTISTAPASQYLKPIAVSAGLAMLAIFSILTFVIFSPPTPEIIAFKPATTTPQQDAGTIESNAEDSDSDSEQITNAPDAAVQPLEKENLAELSIDIDGLFDAVTDTLTTVTDKSSAIDALPQLHYLNGKAEDLQILCANLPADSRSILRDMIDSSMTELLDSASRATSHKETAKVIGPVLQTLTTNLENFDSLESIALARQR